MLKDKIYNGDCLEGMQGLPDKCIDIVVTDPPYLMGYQSNWRTKKFDKIENDNNTTFIPQYFKECERVMKDNTAIYCFCSWHHVDLFKQEFTKYFKLKNILIWIKNNHGSGDLKGAYAPQYEMILYGHKGRALLQQKRMADIIYCPKVAGSIAKHQTQKPISLLETFIVNNSHPGDVVLDGCMGVGSTAQAAINTGRHFIGWEIADEYYQIASQLNIRSTPC